MEFKEWGRTPHLFGDVVITEKIDGTNSAIGFDDDGTIFTQSRHREIVPGDDNYGFAAWAYKNSEKLFELLGPGRHFGEWWGKGIQRNYGQESKRFSLFNLRRHDGLFSRVDGVTVDTTQVLYRGVFTDSAVHAAMLQLATYGSAHVPGFMNPEGVVTFHVRGEHVFKTTLNGDKGKWELRAGSPADLQGMLEAERSAAQGGLLLGP